MARLSIEVSEAEHHEIKALAALSGKTIRQFILDKVFGKIGRASCRERVYVLV